MTGELRETLSLMRSSLIATFRPPDLEESRLAALAAGLANQLADWPPRSPSLSQREALGRTLIRLWRNGQLPQHWPAALVRRAGWVVLDSWPGPGGFRLMLAEEPGFLHPWLTALENQARIDAAGPLLHSLLRLYPVDRPYLPSIRDTLKRLIARGEGPTSRIRREISQHFGLLANDGPRTLMRQLSRGEPLSVLKGAGLAGELIRGRFVEEAWSQLASEAQREKSSETDKLGPVARRLLALSLVSATPSPSRKVSDISPLAEGLRFPQRGSELANALLLPWQKQATKLPTAARDPLLAILGDPREERSAGNWQGVAAPARAVLYQNLAGETLEDFFKLLESIARRDPAIDRYRHQRKALWESCRRQGALTDAWITIGPALLPEAIRCFGERAKRYGILGHAVGARSHHGLLLLRVAGVTLAEGSHGGPYHLWLPDNSQSPPFYQTHYATESLERAADRVRARYDDPKGGWRADLLRYLTSVTGVRLELDYSE